MDETMHMAAYNYFVTKKLNGGYVYRRFYGSELREEKIFFDEDLKTQMGISKHFFEGKLKRTENYVLGKRVGEALSYYPSGEIESRATFVNDLKEGKAYQYYESGKTKLTQYFVRGQEQSPRIYHYPGGQKELSANVKSAENSIYKVLDGKFEYFDSLGVKVCEGTFSENKIITEDCMPESFENYSPVDKMPIFTGGEEAMMKFIYQNIRYPALARKHNLSGLIVIGFIVNEDGSLSDYKIKRGIDPSLAEEGLRVVKSMPRWKPGIKGKMPVKVAYNLPIRFKLE